MELASIEFLSDDGSLTTTFMVSGGIPRIRVTSVGTSTPYDFTKDLSGTVNFTGWNSLILNVTFGASANGSASFLLSGTETLIPGITTALAGSNPQVRAAIGINAIDAPACAVVYDDVTIDKVEGPIQP